MPNTIVLFCTDQIIKYLYLLDEMNVTSMISDIIIHQQKVFTLNE